MARAVKEHSFRGTEFVSAGVRPAVRGRAELRPHGGRQERHPQPQRRCDADGDAAGLQPADGRVHDRNGVQARRHRLYRVDGSSYFVAKAFIGNPGLAANDVAAGNLSLNVQGVPLPIPSKLTFDATQNLTLDKIIANFAASFVSINAAIAKIQANVTAINNQLGYDNVSKFPLTLQ